MEDNRRSELFDLYMEAMGQMDVAATEYRHAREYASDSDADLNALNAAREAYNERRAIAQAAEASFFAALDGEYLAGPGACEPARGE